MLSTESTPEVSQTTWGSAVMRPPCCRNTVACAAMPAASSMMSVLVTENRWRAGMRSRPLNISALTPAPKASPMPPPRNMEATELPADSAMP